MNTLTVNSRRIEIIEDVLLVFLLLWICSARNSFFENKFSNELTIGAGMLMGAYLLIKTGFKNFCHSLRSYCIPMIIIVVVSSILAYTINDIPVKGYIAPSIKRCMSYVAAYIVARYGIFRKKSKFVLLLFISLLLAYLTVFVQYIYYGGIEILFSFMNRSVCGISIETENVAFSIALLLIWFVCSNEYSAKLKVALIGISCLTVFFCNKRTLYFALGLSLLIYFLITRIDFPKNIKIKVLITGSLFVMTGLVYICMIKYGFYSGLLEKIGRIDSNRGRIWGFFANSYTFSPLYCGKSICYTDTIMKNLYLANILVKKNQCLLLHNDLLRAYIGWGFIPFAYYLVNHFIIVPLDIIKNKNASNIWLYMMTALYVFFVMFFDNMLTQPIFNICMFSVFSLMSEKSFEKCPWSFE